jgi:hypothetical protein
MTLSAAQTRQWCTVGLAVIILSRWRSDSGLHEAWTGHLPQYKTAMVSLEQCSVNTKQSASFSVCRIPSNNRHKWANFSNTWQICPSVSTQPKIITVLVISSYVCKIAQITFNTYSSHRPLIGFAYLNSGLNKTMQRRNETTHRLPTEYFSISWHPHLELVYIYRNINTLP